MLAKNPTMKRIVSSALAVTMAVSMVSTTALATEGSEEELLTLCQELERRAGRPAVHSSRESRVLDIDLILFGDRVRHDPRLTLPHPRAQQREFVLKPLAQIAPELRFPDSGRTVAECLQNLSKEN